jgi:deoxyribodipyrimidine photo-lyase
MIYFSRIIASQTAKKTAFRTPFSSLFYRQLSTSTMSPGHKKVIIQLHYNDLRVHDSPTLAYAHAKKNSDVTHFLPLYVFDERVMALQCIPGYEQASLKDGQARPVTVQGLGNAPRNYKEQPLVPEPRTRQGRFWKTGRHRVKFTTESVFDLKQRYRSLGGDLWVAAGVMEDVVREVVGALQEENDEGGFAVNEVWMQKEVRLKPVRCNLPARGLNSYYFNRSQRKKSTSNVDYEKLWNHWERN